MRNSRLTLLSFSALLLSSTAAQAQITEAEAKASEKAAVKAPAAEPAATPTKEEKAAAAESPQKPEAKAEVAEEDAAPSEAKQEAEATEKDAADGEKKAEAAAAATPSKKEKAEERNTVQLLAESRALEKKRKEMSGEDLPPPEDVDPNTLPFTYHVKHLDLQGGVTMIRAASNGLEPYREKPFLAQGFARLGGTVYAQDRLGITLTGGIAGGSYNSNVREQSSHLGLFELNLGAEARYHFHHRFYGYGRVSGGPELASTEIGSGYDNHILEAKSWAFRADATVGAAARIFGASDGSVRGPRFWVFGDIGYRLATQHKQEMQVAEGGPARPEEVDMENFSTSGLTGSIGVALTY